MFVVYYAIGVWNTYNAVWNTLLSLKYCVICTVLCDLYRAVNSRPLCLKTVPSKGLMETNSSNHNSGSARAGLHSGTRKRLRKHTLIKQWDCKVWRVHRFLPSFDNTARWVEVCEWGYTLSVTRSQYLYYLHAGIVQADAFAALLWKVQLETRYCILCWQQRDNVYQYILCSCLCKSMSCGHYKHAYICISCVHAYVYQYLVFMPMYISILCSCLHISISCHAYVYLPTITAVVSCYLSQQQEATQRPTGTGDHPNSTGWVIITIVVYTLFS